MPVTIIGTTRADDIVRDRAILPLYRRAGVIRFLLGLDFSIQILWLRHASKHLCSEPIEFRRGVASV